MRLNEYQRKRDFSRTREPRGRHAAGHGDAFVIHKHAARRLHYDLRLEHDGVLLSWAVPKGPSLDPREKRLAVEVEPHPVEYGEFEGIIPDGSYGAGPSALWDRGRWEPLEDVDEGLARGKLKFRLHGEKLSGTWNLVRSGGRKSAGKQWLLMKIDDEAAEAGFDIDAVGPDSIKTGRSLEQIRADPDYVWEHGEPVAQDTPATPSGFGFELGALPRVRKGRPPETFKPELATLVKTIPAGEQWLHEIKLDGYRLLCRLRNGRAQLITRNGKDWTERFANIAEAASALPVDEALLDGEIVVLRPDGLTDFQALQNVMRGEAKAYLTYYLFDLPYCGGYDLTRTPLIERKRVLRALLADAALPLRYSDHIQGQGEAIFLEACPRRLEGLISKRADSPYSGGRGRAWVKTKCLQRQEFVIGGYTEPQGAREGFGALLLGYHDEDGKLRYAGRVGTGFNAGSLRTLSAELERRERKTPPFRNPPTGAEAAGVHWVRADLMAEVEFVEWTGDGRLRHPSFQGLREDKAARNITRERPAEQTPSPSARPRAVGDTVAGLKLSNPERVLYPEQGVTKFQLAAFYEAIAERILPHVLDRPLSLVRCPQGSGRTCFFQRHLTESMPEAVTAVNIPEKGKSSDYVVIRDLKGLIALVQMGVLEMHPWGARADNPERPDRMVIDLDPGAGTSWRDVCTAALDVRARLEALGLSSFLKTTGGKGLHVVLPVDRRTDWDTFKAFAKALAVSMEQDDPRRYVATMSKAKRQGRIFIDYLRNGRGATAVAAYSTRARAGAPVATPLRWDELETLESAAAFTVRNLEERLHMLEQDPWEGFFELRQSITRKMRRALGLKD